MVITMTMGWLKKEKLKPQRKPWVAFEDFTRSKLGFFITCSRRLHVLSLTPSILGLSTKECDIFKIFCIAKQC
ncbi:hypothetical protein VNO77_25269 [Canavalia gladiata]|uniref:Uncharacterized protein n=1 Tax=Canavalia gladiata TaxID=3824 RepID=A0AAN9LCZ3_CANGL